MIYSQDQFMQRLREERNRSDHSRRPFSLLLMHFAHSPLPHRERAALLKALQDSKDTTRTSDPWGWFAEGTLALLLPDTDHTTAELVASRLREHLKKALGEQSFLSNGFFSIVEYPRALHDTIESRLSSSGAETSPNDRIDSLLNETTSIPIHLAAPWRQKLYDVVKRFIDLTGSLAAILLLSPVLVLLAALVRFSSPGPALFRQTRIGQHGRPFIFLKFRTMYHNCDQSIHEEYVTKLIQATADPSQEKGILYYKIVNDPRITPIGKLLRRTSLDELPQLFNVVKGEMSLVGPRPPVPYEVTNYESWQLRRILEVKPGITGLWQVSGRSRLTFQEQVRLDLQYIRLRSLWLDIKILFRTIPAVFSTRDAC